MKDHIITIICAALIPVASIITMLLTNRHAKKKFLADLRNNVYEHKRGVYEQLFTSTDDCLILVYESKPFQLLSNINQAVALANPLNVKLLQELYNFVDCAEATDIAEIKKRLQFCQVKLNEELAKDLESINKI